MKLPFSYRQHFFSRVLFVSILGHAVLIASPSVFFSSPRYGVEKAPSSMEVVILEKPQVRPKRVETPSLLLTQESSKKVVAPKKKEESRPEKKSVYVPPIKGAKSEARPVHLQNPAPVYPAFAREQGWEGVAVLKVLVGKEGAAAKVIVERSCGYKILDDAAYNAVKKWRFQPAGIGRMSFASWVRIPVRFQLVDES